MGVGGGYAPSCPARAVHGIPMPALRAKACVAPIWLIIPACFSSSSLSALSCSLTHFLEAQMSPL